MNNWELKAIGVLLAIAVIIVGATAIATGGFSDGGGGGGGGGGSSSGQQYSGPEVVYKITGTADSVSVTLSNASGGTEQYGNVYLPKEYRYYSFDSWFLYISAQNNGETGTVIVSIYVDGILYKTSTSSGAYVIANASGSK